MADIVKHSSLNAGGMASLPLDVPPTRPHRSGPLRGRRRPHPRRLYLRRRSARRLQRAHEEPHRSPARGLRRRIWHQHRRALRRLGRPGAAHRRGGRPHARGRVHLAEPRRRGVPRRRWAAGRAARRAGRRRARGRRRRRHRLGSEGGAGGQVGRARGAPPTFDNNTAIVEAVGRGEVPIGLVNHYYAFRAKAEDPDLPVENHYFPDGDLGSTLLVTAASIMGDADMAGEAEQLVEFLLSAEAQQFFSEETFESPLAEGAGVNDALPPFEEISKTRIDLDKLGGGLERTTAMIDESGLND